MRYHFSVKFFAFQKSADYFLFFAAKMSFNLSRHIAEYAEELLLMASQVS